MTRTLDYRYVQSATTYSIQPHTTTSIVAPHNSMRPSLYLIYNSSMLRAIPITYLTLSPYYYVFCHLSDNICPLYILRIIRLRFALFRLYIGCCVHIIAPPVVSNPSLKPLKINTVCYRIVTRTLDYSLTTAHTSGCSPRCAKEPTPKRESPHNAEHSAVYSTSLIRRDIALAT